MATCSMIACEDEDCVPDAEHAANSLTYEITTGEAAYYVNNRYAGTTPDDMINSLVIDPTAQGSYTIDVYPAAKETLTLYPIVDIALPRDAVVMVYLHTVPWRNIGKISAIKFYRQLVDVGLKEAKDAIEQQDVLKLVCMPYGVAVALQDQIKRAQYRSDTENLYDANLFYTEKASSSYPREG